MNMQIANMPVKLQNSIQARAARQLRKVRDFKLELDSFKQRSESLLCKIDECGLRATAMPTRPAIKWAYSEKNKFVH